MWVVLWSPFHNAASDIPPDQASLQDSERPSPVHSEPYMQLYHGTRGVRPCPLRATLSLAAPMQAPRQPALYTAISYPFRT